MKPKPGSGRTGGIGVICLISLQLLAGYSAGAESRSGNPADDKPAISRQESLAISEKNYAPLRLAREEIEVMHAKAAEAARNLWPNFSAKGEYTKGAEIEELGTPGFEEKSYGLQLSHTLFKGGGIWAAYQQADANLLISRFKYQKVRQDMIYRVTEAYWNLARTQADLSDCQRGREALKQYDRMAKKLYRNGVIDKRQLLATESQLNQSEYQYESARIECEKFLWEWTAALGLDNPPDRRPPQSVPFQKLEIKLNECLPTALAGHPEILMQEAALQASGYELKVRNSADWPKLELNGFYGRSGGAYQSETLELNEDYNITVKLTQTLAWNTLEISGFDQKTSPKLGQSTRTEARTATAALGFMDGYKAAAEKREAGLNRREAEFKLKQAQESVAAGVREAFYNYRKALIQIKNAELDLDLSRKGLAINKINLRDSRATIDDVAKSRNELANAGIALREAKVFYLISRAALDRAIGKPGKYEVGE
ncbi:TolC family protein [bacterium]|nr:TolC family protein [bacterium]